MAQLVKKLEYINQLYFRGFIYTKEVRKLYDNNQIEVVSKEWVDRSISKSKPLDLKKSDNWSTYDNCSDGIFQVDGDKLLITVTIWEGDMLDGERKYRRWVAEFEGKLTEKNLTPFKRLIERGFNLKIERAYEQELQQKKENRILELTKEILNN